jgi:hypothetical protein
MTLFEKGKHYTTPTSTLYLGHLEAKRLFISKEASLPLASQHHRLLGHMTQMTAFPSHSHLSNTTTSSSTPHQAELILVLAELFIYKL